MAVTGTVTAVNDDATAIGFDDDGGRPEGVGMTAATTRLDGCGVARRRHDPGMPAAGSYGQRVAIGERRHQGRLQPGSYGQRIEAGVLNVRGAGLYPHKLVAWVRCLA